MIFLLHVELPEMPPYKLLLTFLTHCVTAISWASGVELNYTKKR